MSSQNKSSFEDLNELIIHYVKSCPEIWDVKNKYYKDNSVKAKKWASIARELNVPEDFVKSRWQSIRDRFMKERKKFVTRSGQEATIFSTWSLMPHLQFLTDMVEARQTILNFPVLDVTNSQVETSHSRLPSPNILSNSSSHVIQNLSPCASVSVDPRHSSSTYRPSSTPLSSRPSLKSNRTGKKRKNESDPVDEAILNLTSERTKKDMSLNDLTSDDLFFLSISRDSQQLNIREKMDLKQVVLNTLTKILDKKHFE